MMKAVAPRPGGVVALDRRPRRRARLRDPPGPALRAAEAGARLRPARARRQVVRLSDLRGKVSCSSSGRPGDRTAGRSYLPSTGCTSELKAKGLEVLLNFRETPEAGTADESGDVTGRVYGVCGRPPSTSWTAAAISWGAWSGRVPLLARVVGARRQECRRLQLARLRHAQERRSRRVDSDLREGAGHRSQAPGRPRVHRRGLSRCSGTSPRPRGTSPRSTRCACSRARSTATSRRPSGVREERWEG